MCKMVRKNHHALRAMANRANEKEISKTPDYSMEAEKVEEMTVNDIRRAIWVVENTSELANIGDKAEQR